MPTPRPILSCVDKPDVEDCPVALATGAEVVAVLLLRAVVIIEVIVDVALTVAVETVEFELLEELACEARFPLTKTTNTAA